MRAIKRIYDAPPWDMSEIYRYARCKDDENIRELVFDCINELQGKLSFSLCYSMLPLEIDGDICRMGSLSVTSKKLSELLSDSDSVIVFGATVGHGIDRLIARYSALQPTRAFILDAVGTERIEALCDMFCEDMARETGKALTSRFSPGYGDMDISAQRDIFSLLRPETSIGLTLTDSMLMLPSKSVTAFVGVRQ